MRSRFSVALGLSAMAAALCLPGCATLDRGECETADWQALGLQNGQEGKPATHVARHRKACARYGLPVDADAWSKGWQVGIRNYCTPEGGLRAGERGRSNPEVCPPDLEGQFAYYNRIGRRLYDARSERETALFEFERLRQDGDKAKRRDRRAASHEDVHDARRRLHRAERELRRAQEDADDAAAALRSDALGVRCQALEPAGPAGPAGIDGPAGLVFCRR